MYQGIPGECDYSQTGVESPYLWLSGAPRSQKTMWKVGGGIFENHLVSTFSARKKFKSFYVHT